MSYSPDPLHTRHIRLPEELIELKEILAENVHDMWARQRIAEGWIYGPERDDQARTHPCLVPYDELPESEKQYDRETAVETLRAVFAHGYRILPPAQDAAPVARSSEVQSELAGLRDLLLSARPSDVRTLIARWSDMPADRRWSDLELSRNLIEHLLEFNEPLLAYDFVTEGLTHWPADKRLTQLKGMSLARAGATRKANQVFCQLRDAGHTDEETLGNLARTYKTLWSEAQEAADRHRYLEAAYQAYLASYETTKGYWSGINVAFLALMRGDPAQAREVAAHVYHQCAVELDAARSASADTYWLTATLGEASLIRGELTEAVDWYTRATAVAGRRYGNVASTCRQARALVEHLQLDWTKFASCFPLPEVIVFTSSAATQQGPLFPVAESWQSAVAETMRGELAANRPMFGLSCLRSWWDLVFLETVLQAGGDVAVLLETDDWETARSQQTGPLGECVERAKAVLSRCFEIHNLTARAGSPTVPYGEYAGRILLGLGNMHAQQLGTQAVVLRLPASGQMEPTCEHEPLTFRTAAGKMRTLPIPLDLQVAWERRVGEASRQENSLSPAPDRILGTLRIMALLFADVKGFSRLQETQLIAFTQKFWGTVSELVHSSDVEPATRHTWGDGLFFTFERVADAGTFALDLADAMDAVDWPELGLPCDLSVRIGLHAGPVYECFDPVSGQNTFCGIHVNHAARIEPITPPGNVYASEAFAALASEEQIRNFVCEYVGRTPLAKNFGLFSTYHVRRRAGTEQATVSTEG